MKRLGKIMKPLHATEQSKHPVVSARVFISCGQRKETIEARIAGVIKNKLTKLGYTPYVATQEQTLDGIKENIFRRLQNSEYFLFIDFKRERLCTERGEAYRGSLFSHQELALASYLNKPVKAFQEKGVKPHDGLIGFLQTNPISGVR